MSKNLPSDARWEAQETTEEMASSNGNLERTRGDQNQQQRFQES